MAKTEKRVDLSIIITAHSEGLLLHKTLLSIFRAAEELNGKYSSEIILHLDKPTGPTVDYVERHRGSFLKDVQIFTNTFGDLSLSRNYSVQHSQGRYVAITDGDDLYSKTIFKNALDLLEEKQGVPTVVHAEYTISFDALNTIKRNYNSSNKVIDTLKFLNENQWVSSSVALREVYLKHPYTSNGTIYGYEDKFFNTETLADNIPHLVTQDILFYRRKKEGSILRDHNERYTDIRKTRLFDFEAIRRFDIEQLWKEAFPPLPTTYFLVRATALTKRLLVEYHKANKRASKKYAETYKKLAARLHKNREDNPEFRRKQVPKWVVEEWLEIHKIEQKTFPSRDLLGSMEWYKEDQNIKPGLVYTRTIKQFSRKPDTLYFVPWLIKGGADKVFINYANELSRAKGWRIAVLQTHYGPKSVWADKLVDEIDFVNYAEMASRVKHRSKLALLAKLVIQNDIKRIVLGNSSLGFEFVERYKNLIDELGIVVYAFGFCETFDKEGQRWGPIHTGLRNVYDVTYKIITDNRRVIDKLVDEYGFDSNKFVVHYQPANLDMHPTVINDNLPLRVLWASRVSQQKRPDLLKAIADRLDQSKFTVDAYGEIEKGYSREYFNDSKVNYKRSFNGIADLPVSQYDIFLYTSEMDGVPNMLQEMTAAGLPIVASDVGGINEIIHEGTGLLVSDVNNAEAYVKEINKLTDQPIRKRLNRDAQKLLRERFNEELWKTQVGKDIDR